MTDHTTDTHEADALIAAFALQPHPEGGHFREVYRSALPVATADARGARTALTAIHFLLRAGEHSRWHRVDSDEVWHYSDGEPMELLMLTPDLSRAESVRLGRVSDGATPFHVVPAHWWQAARPVGAYSLCSCVVGPGFDFADFSFMDVPDDRLRVRTSFPELATLI